MKISQREARRLKAENKRLAAILEAQKRWWAQEWPEGIHIAGIANVGPDAMSAINTARKLGHAVVVWTNVGRVEFCALPIPDVGKTQESSR